MRLSKPFYLIKEGIKSVFKHGFMSFASITIIVACLIIMGSFSLVAINIDSLIRELEDQNQVVAFVDDSFTEEEARALQTSVEAVPNVASATFMTRQEAMDEYASKFDDVTLFDDIEASVFRDRYIIYLDDISMMKQTQDDLYKITGIAKVNAELEISRGFVRLRNIVSGISMVLVVVLVVVSVFIMGNTIKLTTFARRDEIAIMKMVGASNGFIRFPFLIEGLVLGLVGAVIAYFAEWGIYQLVSNRIAEGAFSSILTVIPFDTIRMPILIVYLAIGVIVGAFGGIIAIRNYLKV